MLKIPHDVSDRRRVEGSCSVRVSGRWAAAVSNGPPSPSLYGGQLSRDGLPAELAVFICANLVVATAGATALLSTHAPAESVTRRPTAGPSRAAGFDVDNRQSSAAFCPSAGHPLGAQWSSVFAPWRSLRWCCWSALGRLAECPEFNLSPNPGTSRIAAICPDVPGNFTTRANIRGC